MKANQHRKKAWLLLSAGIRQGRIAGRSDSEISALFQRLLADETLNQIRPRKPEGVTPVFPQWRKKEAAV
jgi:hypothetical protein